MKSTPPSQHKASEATQMSQLGESRHTAINAEFPRTNNIMKELNIK